MTTCQEWENRLLDFVLGGLEGRAATEVEEHLESCRPCAAAAAEWRGRHQQMDEGLRTIIQGTEPSPAFADRVLAAVETRRAPAGRLAWAGTLATLAVIALAGVFWLRPEPGSPARTGSPKASLTALSAWRSPTESLLRSPAEELLRSAPPLGQFYFPLESASLPEASQKGVNNES